MIKECKRNKKIQLKEIALKPRHEEVLETEMKTHSWKKTLM
jgi:hypothetical protein